MMRVGADFCAMLRCFRACSMAYSKGDGTKVLSKNSEQLPRWGGADVVSVLAASSKNVFHLSFAAFLLFGICRGF